jgi:predicted amidophosphoribosyltransferase
VRQKERALQEVAAAFRPALNNDFLNVATLLPIPPSKAKSDPLYDDRMTRMLRAIRPQPLVDIRELLMQTESSEAVHAQAVRPRPEGIAARYQIDQGLLLPAPRAIAICDDVLTTGAHYRAVHSVLQQVFPGVRTIGPLHCPARAGGHGFL